jgi:hypothetical protein
MKNLSDDKDKTTTTKKELHIFCCCWTMYNKTALLLPAPRLQQQDHSPLPHHLREAQD